MVFQIIDELDEAFDRLLADGVFHEASIVLRQFGPKREDLFQKLGESAVAADLRLSDLFAEHGDSGAAIRCVRDEAFALQPLEGFGNAGPLDADGVGDAGDAREPGIAGEAVNGFKIIFHVGREPAARRCFGWPGLGRAGL